MVKSLSNLDRVQDAGKQRAADSKKEDPLSDIGLENGNQEGLLRRDPKAKNKTEMKTCRTK